MTDSTVANALAYYARHSCALFPIPAGAKNPTGIVESFAKDCSAEPAQWSAWSAAHSGCNWGLVAGPSRLIIMDTDAKEDRIAAWAARCALMTEWGVDPAAHSPHVQSARGGWHDLFAVPEGVDARALRQPDAVKKLINIRAGNGFVVAAGSYYDGTAKGEASGPYLLLSDAPPHPAPPALVAHCTRVAPTALPPSGAVQGSRDHGDVAALVRWLAERDAFTAYEDWCGVGMALKLEFGDGGLDLWQLAHDVTVDSDTESTKWRSFANEPTAGSQTLNTWMDRAHKLGWRGTIRKSAGAMFNGVAAIAAAAGATLPTGTPVPSNGASGVPMMAGQAELERIARPILDEFLSATLDAPTRPMTTDYPNVPEACAGHGLFEPLRACVDRVLGMAEGGAKSFRASRVVDALAVLSLVHLETYESVCRKIRTFGCTLPESKIKLYAASIADKVERVFTPQDAWHYDAKGLPETDNSDNMAIFLEILGCEIRWNAWLERAEIRGYEWSEWQYIDDAVVAKLRTRGNRTKTRFRPGKDFFWESLLALSHANKFDPVLDRLAALQAAWDGVPRLSIWLSAACGVKCDPYHQAVSRNIIGGMVRRARHPGCKHDTMAVLYGPQGTAKSTLAAVIADMGASSLEGILIGTGQNFTDTILLGDAAKELVLSLAGKTIAEIGEMGMRGAANPNHVKAMISRQVDSGRTAYARSVTERPRRNIFIGTTNDSTPLEDPTGNRRFLPVSIEREINLEWLHQNIAQIIGEAATLDAVGQDFGIPRAVWGDAAEYQEAARSESDVETLLNEWFTETEHTAIAFVTAADLVQLSMLAGWRHGGANGARGAYMKRLGFRKETPYIAGKKTRVWARGPDVLPKNLEKVGMRYMVGVDREGRPRVEARSGAPDVVAPGGPPPAMPGPRA